MLALLALQTLSTQMERDRVLLVIIVLHVMRLLGVVRLVHQVSVLIVEYVTLAHLVNSPILLLLAKLATKLVQLVVELFLLIA